MCQKTNFSHLLSIITSYLIQVITLLELADNKISVSGAKQLAEYIRNNAVREINFNLCQIIVFYLL